LPPEVTSYTLTTLISFFLTPFNILMNVVQYVKAKRIRGKQLEDYARRR